MNNINLKEKKEVQFSLILMSKSIQRHLKELRKKINPNNVQLTDLVTSFRRII